MLFVGYLFEKFPDVELTTLQTPQSPSFSNSSGMASPLTPRSARSARAQRENIMQLIEENQGEKREERGNNNKLLIINCYYILNNSITNNYSAMRVWINSLGLQGYVRNLGTELNDGILILQVQI